MIIIENLIQDEFNNLSLDEFLEWLPTLDFGIKRRIENAKKVGKKLWYIGSADFEKKEYKIGFEEVPFNDLIVETKESDNTLKIFPRMWKRPIIIVGPGAGTRETVTGLISGLISIFDYHRIKKTAKIARAVT